MISEDFEYLFEQDGIEYYALEEYGFTHKKLAKQHHLYENFGKSRESTYYGILCFNLYDDKRISQVWAFKNDIPIALGLAIHEETEKFVQCENSHLKASVLGHIHLYTNPALRGQGIAKNMLMSLENMILAPTQCPPCTVLQDDAYHFAPYLKHSWALPHGIDSIHYKDNQPILLEHFNKAFQNNNAKIKQYFSTTKSKNKP